MNTLDTETPRSQAPSLAGQNGPPSGSPPRRRKSASGRFVSLLILGGLAGGAYYAYTSSAMVRRRVDRMISYVRERAPEAQESPPVARTPGTLAYPRWDGLVSVTDDDAKTLGLVLDVVQPQVQPIKLELPGRTDYDPNTLSKIRPRFDTLVERVRAARPAREEGRSPG